MTVASDRSLVTSFPLLQVSTADEEAAESVIRPLTGIDGEPDEVDSSDELPDSDQGLPFFDESDTDTDEWLDSDDSSSYDDP
jgi:hypothetical protein